MEKHNIERVVKVLARVKGTFNDNLDYNGNLKDELGLDSIQIVEFFAELEQEFQIELPLKMMTVKTAKEFLDLLEQELAFANVA
jgi:acyl carrier protein